MPRRRAVIWRGVPADGCDIYIRGYPGKWTVMFTPERKRFPDWDGWTAEPHLPRGRDSTADADEWARAEWSRQVRDREGAG